jgi:uroporphyrinogen-III synthase
MTPEAALQGLRVLVTRPVDQAERLCRLIRAAGGTAVRLPAIEILDPLDTRRLEAVTAGLSSCDLAVFISVNAVRKGLDFITARGAWPGNLRIATVGARSAQALEAYGLAVDLVPQHQFNSEALLALDELQDMSGQRVIIFRGNGGREHLFDTLTARGARVEYAEVYRRACPEVDAASLLPHWQPGALDVITITSNESLQNLYDMAGAAGQPLLLLLPLVVAGRRQALLAEQLGFSQPAWLADNAGDEALVAALHRFRLARGG